MHEYFASSYVKASPDEVWAVIADIDRWPAWTPSVLETRVFDGEPPGLGERVLVRQPKLRDAMWTITRWDPASRFTWFTTHPGVRVEGDHILIAARGGTEVHLRLSFQGWLSGLAVKLFGNLTRSYLALEAVSLKAACERGP